MPVSVICKTCGKSFVSPVRKGKTSKFCSHQCYAESLKGHSPHLYKISDVICPQCGKMFHPSDSSKKFCSRSCAASWNMNPEQRGQGTTRIIACKTCGKQFSRHSKNHKYCSHDCFAKDNMGDNNHKFNEYVTDSDRYLRYTDRHPIHHGKYVHQVIYDEVIGGTCCESCGGELQHVHHKDENRKNNNPENLMGLCNECHARIHAVKNRFWKHRQIS